jgi:hypothetical protein
MHMSATLTADDRQGPETRRIPEHGSESLRDKTDNETPDTGNVEAQIRDHAEGRSQTKPWAPEGFYWGYNKKGDPSLRPHEWYVNDIAKDAENRLARAIDKHGKSEELKELIKAGAEELLGYLQTRKAINAKSFERKLKGEADDAAYQIVQAAKYRRDGLQMMENNRRNGYKADNDKVRALRGYADNSLYEGYALTQIVLQAAYGADVVPTFDYQAAAWRVCNWSAQRITETLMAKQRNERNADKLDDEAARMEAEAFFD